MPALLSFFGISPLGALKWVAIAGAVLAVLFGARQAGKNAAKVEQLQATIKAVKVRNEIEDEIRRMPDGAAADELRKRWSRD